MNSLIDCVEANCSARPRRPPAAGLVLPRIRSPNPSPNFRVANRAGVLMELAFARAYVPYLVGEERGFEPLNDLQARYWTTRYGSGALTSLGTLMRETRAQDFGTVSVPVLAIFSEQDRVVSAVATREILGGWGGPVQLAPQTLPAEGVDPYFHVIAGDILSPAMTGPNARFSRTTTSTGIGVIDICGK